jgi:hypothetical protein
MHKKVLAILLATAMVMTPTTAAMASENGNVTSETTEAAADDKSAENEAVEAAANDKSAEGDSAEDKDVIVGSILGEILAEVGYTPGDEKVSEVLKALFGDVTEDGDFNPEDIKALTRELFSRSSDDEETSVGLADLYDTTKNHLTEETSEYLEAGDETIISGIIGDFDEDEDGTLHLLGYFTVMNFDADEENPKDLLVKNGAGLTELITFELNEDGKYEITDYMTAEDGEDYSGSIADMCEYMGIEPDSFFEQMGICDLDYVSDLHNFLVDHPEYEHIEYMGELVSHEDLDNIADEQFAEYLSLYGLTAEGADE